MSLKQFHVLFIVLSLVVSGFFTGWSIVAYQEQASVMHGSYLVISLAGVFGILYYMKGLWLRRNV